MGVIGGGNSAVVVSHDGSSSSVVASGVADIAANLLIVAWASVSFAFAVSGPAGHFSGGGAVLEEGLVFEEGEKVVVVALLRVVAHCFNFITINLQ